MPGLVLAIHLLAQNLITLTALQVLRICLHTAADIYNNADACFFLFAHYCDGNDAKKALFYFEKWPQDQSSSIDDKRLRLAAPRLVELYQQVGNTELAEKYAQIASR